VVVAEDSLTIRELLVALLESDPDISVVGQAKNGAEAVELAERLRPDLIAMDIHMPVLDGLEATKEIMVRAPTPIVLVTSSASREDAALSFDALRAGALTVVAKPADPAAPDFDGRSEQLLRTLKAMADVKVVRRWGPRRREPPERPALARRLRAVAIGASTGGPAALLRILEALPADCPVPILVVQHIAAGFIEALAEWLNGSCGLRVKVAEHQESLAARTVYLAPDDRHLGVTAERRVALSDEAPIEGHRPSATHLFAAAARVFGPAAAAVILTGMGQDGVDGLRQIKGAGGYVIAQDESTSAVYGMPRAAAAAGLADAVLALEDIAPRLVSAMGTA
jgi:two-component system chemotaxis response regulator CheB